MKGFKVSVNLAVAMFLAIIVTAILVGMINPGQTITTGTYQPPGESFECSVNSDCYSSPKGMLCLSINNEKLHCGCLESTDCPVGKKCVYNVCE